MSVETADEADALADLVNRWSVRRIDPERFHVDRDLIAKRLRRLAERLRGEARNGGRPTTTWRSDAARDLALDRADDAFRPRGGDGDRPVRRKLRGTP